MSGFNPSRVVCFFKERKKKIDGHVSVIVKEAYS